MILLFRNDCHMWWISNSWNVPVVWKTMALDNIWRWRRQSFLSNIIALCGYPIVKIEIRDSSQTSTTAPIFFLSIISDRNIWRLPAAQFHFWMIFGYELITVYCSSWIYKKSIAVQAVCRQDVNKIVGTSWTLTSKKHQIFCTMKKITKNICIFQIPFSQWCWPQWKMLFWGFFLSLM